MSRLGEMLNARKVAEENRMNADRQAAERASTQTAQAEASRRNRTEYVRDRSEELLANMQSRMGGLITEASELLSGTVTSFGGEENGRIYARTVIDREWSEYPDDCDTAGNRVPSSHTEGVTVSQYEDGEVVIKGEQEKHLRGRKAQDLDEVDRALANAVNHPWEK